MKKKVVILVVVLLVVAGAFCAKGYYNDRYVVSDCYYTQVPEDEVNEDSWLVDKDGARQAEGKSYELMGYNEQGEQREVYFTKSGSAEDYYDPGTYIKVNTSKTIVLDVQVVDASSIPQPAMEKIRELGTKAR